MCNLYFDCSLRRQLKVENMWMDFNTWDVMFYFQGLRMMTSVAQPVFDRRNETVSNDLLTIIKKFSFIN